jgi:hypothetical protein
MSSKRSLHLCLVLTILLSGVVTPLLQPSVAVAALPDTPTNNSPLDNATDVPLTPTLVASSFYDSENDTHIATYWQITRMQGNYTSQLAWQSENDTYNLENITCSCGYTHLLHPLLVACEVLGQQSGMVGMVRRDIVHYCSCPAGRLQC